MAKVVSVEKEPVVSPIKSITVELTADEADLIVSMLAGTPSDGPGSEVYRLLSDILDTFFGSYTFTNAYGDPILSIRPRKGQKRPR